MSEKEKRFAIVAAVVLVAIVLFLMFRKGSKVFQSGGNVTLGGVTIPGLNIPGRVPFIIPDFGGDPYERLTAIGACCSDCSRSTPRTDYRPASGMTIVINEGNQGARNYNYITTAPAPVTIRRYGAQMGG